MYSIDFEVLALVYTDRGLTIGFIVGIFGANCVLIFRTIQKGGFFYTPKSLTLISLAIGDIFLALFPLVVRTINSFEGFATTSCTTNLTALIYVNYIIHFVYATGLVVLAAELVYRYRKQTSAVNTQKNILKAFACSAFPWILALVVILPLLLAGSHANSQSCMDHLTVQRIRVAYGVSVILPAIAAVIVCFVVMCIRFSPAYYTSPAISYQVTNQATFVNPQTTQMVNQQHVLANPVGNPQYPVGSTVVVHQFPVESTGPQQQPNVPDYSKQDPSQAFSAPHAQYPVQQYPAQQVPPQYLAQQYPPAQYATQPNVVIAAPMYPAQVVNTAASAPGLPDLGKERKILLLVSIIHFMCVIPNVVYILGSRIGGYEATYVDLIVGLILQYLSFFRSLITPCLFSFLNK